MQELNNVSTLDQRTRYCCKKCSSMTTAESFAQIVEREKLCPHCLRKDREMKRLFQPVQSLARVTTKTKRIISEKRNYDCLNCGHLTLAVIKPLKCTSCVSKHFRIKKESNAS